MSIHRRQRRGALLLICLVLLVLFLMLGVTFVLTATSFRKGQASNLRAKEFEDRSEDVLDKVMMDLLRGSTNPRSPFRGHSLLGDVYGNVSLKGRIQAVSDDNKDGIDDGIVAGGGQFMKLKLDVDDAYKPLRNFEDYYAGLVLTMLTGPAKGQSTRVVEFDPPDRFVVLAFNGRDPFGNRTYPRDGDRVLVNGRPFTGMGQGYFPDSADFNTFSERVNQSVQISWKFDYALLPNLSFFEPNGGHVGQIPDELKYTSPVGPGDQNEDYDAADFNNPWLAAVTNNGIKPSFHDPQLIHFWLEWLKLDPDFDGTTPDANEFQSIYRKTSFRPVRGDHPKFTGSNPDYNWLHGPWDVDNDGDGNRDSIWMDAGLPVQTLSDGRIVKPLVAMLVQDLDGRINVNVHGSPDLADATDPVSGPLAGGETSARMPRGSGTTPSEVDLRWALVVVDEDGELDVSSAGEVHKNLLNGTRTGGIGGNKAYPGRYGETPGGNNGPGRTGVNDTYSRIAATHLFGGIQSFFGSPCDIRGVGAVAVDHRGQKMTAFMGAADDFTDEPGEILLGPRALANPFDRPFTPAEFERILRHADVDAFSLPRRLLELSTVTDSGPMLQMLVANRHVITSESWDMPVYSPAIFHGNNDKSQRKKFADAYTKQIIPRHIVDLFIARILQDQESSNPGDAEAIVRNLIENDCLAPEMLAGLKFNVNRLFGNGRDDDTEEGSPGHGIVDEPAEIGRELLYGKLGDNGVADVAEATQAENGGPYRHPFDSVRPDFNRDGNFSPSVDAAGGNLQRRYAAYHGGEPQANGSIAYGGDYSVRQDYARQLYCLMLAVVDEDAILAHYLGPDEDVNDERQVRIAHEKFARHVAQYAVNVVDFRDPDAIMTPFRYDPFPFVDGWDTNPSTENFDGSPRLVWGCETPVALLSESLALHDRGLKNAIKDAIPSDDPEMAGGWMASTEDDSDHKVADGDAHFDQDRVPRGSAFFEVYCPASPHRPHSAELFTNGKLDLARMDDGGNGDNPVWRIAISAPHVTTVNDQRPTPSISDIIKDPIARKKLYMEPPAPRDADAGVGEILAYTAPFLAGERGDIPVPEIRIRADRYIWFSTNVPTNNSDATYFNQFEGGNDPNTLLSPGEYVVVGPRTHTIISHLEDDDPKNRQMIKLAPEAGTALEGKIHVTNGDRSSDYPANAQIKVPKAIICKTKPATPPGWDSPIAMGLNVSEPLRANYYPKPDKLSQILDGNPNPEIINDGHRYSRRITENDDEGLPLDVPLDQPDGMNANGVGGNSPVALILDTRLPWDPDFLVPWEGVQDPTGQDPLPDRNDTKMNYRTAFLQRLANPTLPYHPVNNPYMTVDWIPVDLTVYNRDEPRSGTVELRSRERGRTLLAGTNPDVYARNLWWPAIIDPTGSQASTGHAFAADLIHSLGFLNRTFSSAPNVTVDRIDTADWFSTAGGAAYVGDPQTPFPWLVWNDRPFISQFELMQVPSTSAGFLGLEFTSVHSANVSSSPVNLNPYRNFNNTYKNNAPIIAFGHLMNFFHSLKGQENPGIQLGRVFDFMHVPSYYSNSHTALNATDLMGEDGVDQRNPEAPDSNFDKKKNYAPPYNYISNYREPGRVNLNTIYDARVWWALMHGRKDPRNNEHLEDQRHPGPSWEAFVRHRRGYTSGNDMESRILAREPTNQLAGQQQDFYPVNAPSYFCLPYRSQGNFDLHPYINYRDLDNGVVVDTVDFTGVDASLLRRHVLALDFSINLGTDFPLFRDTTDGFKDKPEKSYADSSANSYFKYQPINRLGNLTTTRSNVYAVWITVGYFEVSTPPRWGTDNFVNNFIYPDGYQIGRELGEDTGDIKRHRAFYMVDRTIPVGYENGHDHNVDEVILLRRQIE